MMLRPGEALPSEAHHEAVSTMPTRAPAGPLPKYFLADLDWFDRSGIFILGPNLSGTANLNPKVVVTCRWSVTLTQCRVGGVSLIL
jgi:hypothetical protein